MATDGTALVLGATGGIGGAVAQALLARGWRVRALNRRAAAQPAGPIAWLQGDAMVAADVAAAARGASLIVHGVNPPRYRNWPGLVVPMLDNTLAAAAATGARVLFPGTVYNYGPDAGALVAEDAAQAPQTRKGAIRVQAEQRLARFAGQGGRVLLVRAGDFFGGRGNNWFSDGLVRPGRPVRRVIYPGDPAIGHAWAYLPDMAEAMVRLLERTADRPGLEAFHLEGHWITGHQMIAAIAQATGCESLPVWRMPWALVRLASPLVPICRELAEMRYLWQTPLRLDNRRLLSVLGAEPRTPLVEAVGRTLAQLGCLPGPAGAVTAPA